jgi:hypothetical protein
MSFEYIKERVDKHDEILAEFKEFIAVMNTRNEYDRQHQSQTDKLLEELVKAKTEHDKRITALEVLPLQVKDIQDSRTIRTDRAITEKLKSSLFIGIIVVAMIAILSTLMIPMLFYQRLYETSQTINQTQTIQNP